MSPSQASLLVHVLCCVGIVNTLDLDQAGARVCVALATLVAQVATPRRAIVSTFPQFSSAHRCIWVLSVPE